jgi:YebC/PmpR family DNA-binding regulatory protein
MPTVNVERAIKRGAGETGEVVLEEMVFEAYGPGNIAIIIEGITDNSNRSVAEVKQILGKNNGKLAAEGSVRWLFERKGEISLSLEAQPENLQNKEALELLAIDLGAEDISWDENLLQIYTNADNIGKIKSELEAKGIEIESSGLGWRAKDEISVSEKDVQLAERLFAALDESDDVQEIYSNLKS